MKLLIIEDDSNIVSTIKFAFQLGWPSMKLVTTDWGQEGIALAETESPDAVLLDLKLPDINGLEVIKNIRLFSVVPILVLTADSTETTVVQALELGANAYVFKPFRQMELLARVKRMLTLAGNINEHGPIIWGPFQYDYNRREVICGSKIISLRCTENEIFNSLIVHAPNVATYSTLAKSVWGDDYTGAEDCLKVHIRHLRQKLENAPSQPRVILTRTGVGYYLAKP